MTLSSDQIRIAGELVKRFAAGDEAALEDITEVIRAIIREGDENSGMDVIYADHVRDVAGAGVRSDVRAALGDA